MLANELTRRRLLSLGSGALAAQLLPTAQIAVAEELRTVRGADFRSRVDGDLFRSEAGNGARAATSDRWLKTPPLRPGHSFDLIGLELPNRIPHSIRIELRFKAADGRWSEWVPAQRGCDHAPDSSAAPKWSDPIWTGRTELVQLRASRKIDGIQLHLVDCGHPGAKRHGHSLLGLAAGRTLKGSASSRRTLRLVNALAPPVVSREGWGAGQLKPRGGPSYGQIQLAFVHHTVTANAYTPQQSAAMVLGIYRYHRNANGWDDIGYNFLVDRYGQVFEGRSGGAERAVIGAQAQGYNAVSTGIAHLGTYGAVAASNEALEATARLIAWKLAVHGVSPRGTATVKSSGGPLNRYPQGRSVTFQRISGHRDGDSTSCPGGKLYGQLPQLRARVLELSRDLPKLTAKIDTGPVVVYPASVKLSGRLLAANGLAIANAKVAVQRYGKTGFVTIAETVTTGGGAWSTAARVGSNTVLRAVYIDGSGNRSAYSQQYEISTSPTVTLSLSTPQTTSGTTVTASGTTRPRVSKLKLIVELQNPSTGIYKQTAERTLAVDKNGRFSTALKLLKPGLYRLRAIFPGDTKNGPGKSQALPLKVVAAQAPVGTTPTPQTPPPIT